MPTTASALPVRRREIFGWAMFDFANSSYTTVIVTVAFSVFFTKIVAGGPNADTLWSYGIAATNLIVLLLSPIVGAIADGSGRKKAFLLATYLLCVVGTAGLWFATPGRVALALGLLVVSNIGFSFGENLAGAFLPEISNADNVGRISAIGWGVGYFGGLACLLLVRPLLAGLDLPRAELLAPENAHLFAQLRWTWVVTAAFFLVSALPTFLLLRERAPRRRDGGLAHYAREGFGRLGETMRSIGQFTELRRFLIVFFLYHAGLTAVIAFAGIIYEKTFGFTAGELVTLFLALQLFSAAGAWVFGQVQDRLGGRRTIQIVLLMWIAAGLGVAFADSRTEYWLVAAAAGLGIGALQSASRAMVGLFSPAEKSGEFFGFWGLAAKAAYFTGPLVFGKVSALSGSHRTAMLAVTGFFVAGLIGMQLVDERRGRREVEVWQRKAAAPAAS